MRMIGLNELAGLVTAGFITVSAVSASKFMTRDRHFLDTLHSQRGSRFGYRMRVVGRIQRCRPTHNPTRRTLLLRLPQHKGTSRFKCNSPLQCPKIRILDHDNDVFFEDLGGHVELRMIPGP